MGEQQPDRAGTRAGGAQSPVLRTDLGVCSSSQTQIGALRFHSASHRRRSSLSSGPHTPWAASHSPGATAPPPPPADAVVQSSTARSPPLPRPPSLLSEAGGGSGACTQLWLLGKAFLLRRKWQRVDGARSCPGPGGDQQTAHPKERAPGCQCTLRYRPALDLIRANPLLALDYNLYHSLTA